MAKISKRKSIFTPLLGAIQAFYCQRFIRTQDFCAASDLLSAGDHFATAAFDLAEHEVLRAVEAERLQNTRLTSPVELVL